MRIFAALVLALGLSASLAACGQDDVLREIERAEAKAKADAAAAVEQSQAFVENAKKEPGAVSLPSGLVYVVQTRGPDQSLPSPDLSATVKVHYEGSLPNGTVFDSSIQRGEPAEFELGQVVPGFSEAISHMKPGDEVIAYLPANLGYGERGSPPVIPANVALKFRIQLISYKTASGQSVPAGR